MNIDSTLIGTSPAIRKLRRDIASVAKKHSHVLIIGESGTGKTLIAQIIHHSNGQKGALQTVNALTATDAGLQSLLDAPRRGVRTILLQNIDEFSFLQQAIVNRVIGNLHQKPFVRVIVTISDRPSLLVHQQKLIPELAKMFERFDECTVPALAKRPADIPMLVEHFAKNACAEMGIRLKSIDINTLDFLVKRSWKDNIRELRAVVEKGILGSEGEALQLPEYLMNEQAQLEAMIANISQRKSFSFDRMLANLERTLLHKTLDVVAFNRTKAAAILDLSEANLRYRIKKFHLLPPKQNR